MAVAFGPSLDRRPHRWRLRRTGLRARLLSRGWGIRGAYAEKVIRGRAFVVRAVDEDGDWVICWFEYHRL